jgi:hypothetical protein
MYLARWNYSKEEWTNFMHWKMKRKGPLFFLFQWLRTNKTQDVPEIRIATDRVWINNTHEPFQNNQRRFREIHIRDTGSINVLEIKYVRLDSPGEKENRLCEIKVPIPRGKLREAFEIQERLIIDNGSIG